MASSVTFILLLVSFLCAGAATILGFGLLGSDPFDVATWAGWISLSVVFFVLALLVGGGIPDFGDLTTRRRRD